MFNKPKERERIVLIVLSLGIIICLIYAQIFWKNYEKYSSFTKFGTGIYDNDENAEYLKGNYSGSKILNGQDVFLYFITAEEILNSLKKKNFFYSQPEFKISFLHPNIIAFFSYITKDNIIENHENNKNLIIGKKKKFNLFTDFYLLLFFIFFI